MGKINSAYPTLIAGVSQAPAEARMNMEHWDQVNMVSDTIRGLTRRPGSRQLAHTSAGTLSNPTASATDAGSFRSVEFTVGGSNYSVAMRHSAKTSGSNLAAFHPVNLSAGTILAVNRPVTDASLDLLEAGGVRAVTALGRFLIMSGNTLPVAYTTTERWAPADNQSRHVVWVRGGAYSRAFKLSLIRGNQKFVSQYTTPAASYPTPLDTSDLLATDPDYLRKVQDRTNAYNSAVTKWIGDALAASSPEYIANRLAEELRLSGFLSPGSTVEVQGSSVCITDPSVEDVEADDGGDKSLMRAAGNVVPAPELLTTIAYPGKVIRVRPQSGVNAVTFYVKAIAKDESVGKFTEVSWEECAGTEYLPTAGLCFATIHSGAFYVAGSPAGFRTLTGLDFPDYQPSISGDSDTNAPPEFLSRTIDGLGVFQDRLIIGAGNAINNSQTGDYLNFFRTSVVTVSASDPANFTIIGGEEDTIRKMVLYDRNLTLCGDKRQYVIDGRKPFAPGVASATIMANIPGAASVPHVFAENYLFYVKGGGSSASLHRFRPGPVEENPITNELSEKLDGYMPGTPIDLKVHDTPNFAFVRTSGAPREVFVYQFEDFLNGESKHTAWHRWKFVSDLGLILGVSVFDGWMYVVTRRASEVVLDRIPLSTNDLSMPYLDSMKATGTSMAAPTLNLYRASGLADNYVGAKATVTQDAGPTFYDGYLIEDTYVDLTSPVIRDSNGRAIDQGDLTVSSLLVKIKDSSGLAYKLRSKTSAAATGDVYHGRIADVDYSPDATGQSEIGTWGRTPTEPEVVPPVDEYNAMLVVGIANRNPNGSPGTGSYGIVNTAGFVIGISAGDDADGTDGLTAAAPIRATSALPSTGVWVPQADWTGSPQLGGAGLPALPFYWQPFVIAGQAEHELVVAEAGLNDGFERVALGYRTAADGPILPATTDGWQLVTKGVLGSTAVGVYEVLIPLSALNGVVVEFDNSALNAELAVLNSAGYTTPGGGRDWASDGVMMWKVPELEGDWYILLDAGLATQQADIWVLRVPANPPVVVTPTDAGPGWPGTLESNPPPVDNDGPVTGYSGMALPDDAPDHHHIGLSDYADEDQTTEQVTKIAPYDTAEVSIPIALEAKDYRIALAPYLWGPLTISNIEFTGFYFNHIRRV